MTRLTRADLDTLPAYVPGRTVPGAVKPASNEVPYGPLPGVVEAVAEAAAGVHRHPDMGLVRRRETIADRLGVHPDRVVTGCGSVALAEHLARGFPSPSAPTSSRRPATGSASPYGPSAMQGYA